jgi:hypothetical protein
MIATFFLLRETTAHRHRHRISHILSLTCSIETHSVRLDRAPSTSIGPLTIHYLGNITLSAILCTKLLSCSILNSQVLASHATLAQYQPCIQRGTRRQTDCDCSTWAATVDHGTRLRVFLICAWNLWVFLICAWNLWVFLICAWNLGRGGELGFLSYCAPVKALKQKQVPRQDENAFETMRLCPSITGALERRKCRNELI